MFKTILKCGSIVAVLMTTIYPQTSFGKEFTSAEFLKWPRESQNSYIQTSVGMAAVIGAQHKDRKAGCIGDWYFADEAARQKTMLNSMKQNQQFHPQAIILAFVQKACGSFGK